MENFKEFAEAFGRRHDAYTRDYHSSISGMGSHKHSAAYHADGGANDEGWDREHHHKPADHPHSVHINGKKWKTFGSHSHASNVAKKIKGATVHKEEVQIEEAVNPSEVAGNPRMYNSDTVKKAYYHKNASEADKQSLARHLDRHHGNKEWRKSVKEHTDMCNVCGQTPCNCTHVSEDTLCPVCNQDPCACDDSHGFVKEARMSAAVKLQRAFQREQEKSAASRKRAQELLNPPKKDEPKKIAEGVKSPGVGWMLKQDPKLAAVIKARKEKYKSFKQHVGQKIEDKK